MNRRDMIMLGGALAVGLLIVGRRAQAKPQRTSNRRPEFRPRPLRVRAVERGPRRPRLVIERVKTNDAPASRLGELLEVNIAGDPGPGTFYQVGPQDTPETIARAVLRSVGRYSEAHVLDYIYCFSSSPWNLRLYGGPSTSDRFPSKWLIPGFGQGIRGAFLPRNAAAAALMADGALPPRTVGEKNAKALGDDDQYGLIWLPPVSAEELERGVVTCGRDAWPDGSSKLNPNPELLRLMEAA